MKHLKLFESYYEDLTPYRYGLADKFLDDPEYTKKFDGVNIGWIGDLDNFQKGEVPAKFIDRLIEVEKSDDFTINSHRGSHRCGLCGSQMGSRVKMVEYSGVKYKFPSKISHYVIDHNYRPPSDFIEAIMNLK